MRRRAFTLIEGLLVILLLGLLLAFAFPNYGKMMEQRALEESAGRLRTLIVMCHAKAMQDGLRYRIFFPGTPDPNDKFADEEIDVPFETMQPIVERQQDPMVNPEWYGEVHDPWVPGKVLEDGIRCVAVYPGRPNFDISPDSPIAGPSITEGITEFFRPAFNPDGTCDWATFVLTDLPFDVELEAHHVGRILNVIVDGRTGQVWIQRAMRVEEVELMQEYGASPILHLDFTQPDMITEDNILHIHVRQGGQPVGGRAYGE